MIPYTPPTFQSKSFNCPYCQAYAQQMWGIMHGQGLGPIPDMDVCLCQHCHKYSLWGKDPAGGRMIFPDVSDAPPPNPDLDPDIQADYQEASSILSRSPRGAAALLRLCIQKLCIQLGEKGKDIDSDIKNLVKQGLPARIQQALDIVRVVGNQAVHPGELDLKDDRETATKLFALVNLIAYDRITQPKEIESLYSTLPESKRDAIERRDNPNK